MKRLYLEVAGRCHTNAACVEKDIRTAAEALWKNGFREEFLAYFGAEKRPGNAKLLRMLDAYMKKFSNEKE